ncbi:triosephosphate isomerase-like [Diorhabda sublineata]|uniref:triosephosphate isomerase-like n=1 Tax=Diorhabda sublineata TaxID=1163346 RepID=UPI0024E073CE|nr:triosephosphate isomerase-like [Diorhabda sublineata]
MTCRELFKVALAKKSGLQVVACVGETLAEREAGKTMAVVIKQINAIESQLKGNWTNVILAYEPVWAIGTGKTATPEQAQTVHENIRCFFKDCISFNVAEGKFPNLNITTIYLQHSMVVTIFCPPHNPFSKSRNNTLLSYTSKIIMLIIRLFYTRACLYFVGEYDKLKLASTD